jgi:hypothetical protein
MVTATARNIGALVHGKEAVEQATWNAVCLADFGDDGFGVLGDELFDGPCARCCVFDFDLLAGLVTQTLPQSTTKGGNVGVEGGEAPGNLVVAAADREGQGASDALRRIRRRRGSGQGIQLRRIQQHHDNLDDPANRADY